MVVEVILKHYQLTGWYILDYVRGHTFDQYTLCYISSSTHTVLFLHVTNETSIQTLVNFKKVELFTGRREYHIHSTFEHLKLWQTKTMRASSAHAVTLVTKQWWRGNSCFQQLFRLDFSFWAFWGFIKQVINH